MIAVVLVAAGGWIFTAGMFVLGVICMRELFSMFDRARPVMFGAVVGVAGLVIAAQVGQASSVLLAFVAAIPVVFIIGLRQPGGVGAPGITLTIFGLAWIGIAFAHAVLLRDLPHGGGIVVVVLVGRSWGTPARIWAVACSAAGRWLRRSPRTRPSRA